MTRRLLLTWPLALALCACAPLPPANPLSTTPYWQGRLAIAIDGSPPQQSSAAFELEGDSTTGKLSLYSPLGQTVAVAQWTTSGAFLRQGNDVRRFEDMATLLDTVTGTRIAMPDLFAWVQGHARTAPGWQVNLSDYAAGRIEARRFEPLPEVKLRIVLQP